MTTVIVNAVGARGLKNTEVLSRQDPYLSLQLSEEQRARTTRVSLDTGRSAVWNDSFVFLVNDTGKAELSVTVMNSNVGADTVIGKGKIDISSLLSGDGSLDQWYTIFDEKDGTITAGEVNLMIRWHRSDMFKGLPTLTDPPTGFTTFLVKVVSATELRNTELLTMQDPYVVLTSNDDDQVHKTAVQQDAGVNAVWNEIFVFDTDDPQNKKLTCSVMNKNDVMSDNEIGKIELDLGMYLLVHPQMDGEWEDVVINLSSGKNEKAGEIHLGIKWFNEELRVQALNAALGALNLSRAHILVTAVSARNLKNTELVTKQDPYLTLTVSGSDQVHKTRVHDDAGINAVWGDRFVLTTPDFASSMLTVTVMNANTLKQDNVIGRTRTELPKLLEAHRTADEFDQWVQLTDMENVSKSAGEVLLRIRWFDAVALQPRAPLPELKTEVIVTAVSAKNLKNLETLTMQDPYLTLQMSGNNQVCKTRVHNDGGKSAVWNDSFVFDFDVNSTSGNQLILTCMNLNTLTKDAQIGRVIVNLNDLYKLNEGTVNKTFKEVVALVDPTNVTRSAGEITLEVTWHQYKSCVPTVFKW